MFVRILLFLFVIIIFSICISFFDMCEFRKDMKSAFGKDYCERMEIHVKTFKIFMFHLVGWIIMLILCICLLCGSKLFDYIVYGGMIL